MRISRKEKPWEAKKTTGEDRPNKTATNRSAIDPN